MNLRPLRTFLLVAEHGSFKQAAAKQHLTAPAVSQHMRRLEAELGVQLFVRRPEGVVLTDAGQQFMPFATRIDGELLMARSALRAGASAPDHVSIAASPSMVRYTLPWLLDDASQRHRFPPGMVVTSAVNRVSLAEAAEVDFCVCNSELVTQRLESVHLLSERLIMIAPRGSRLGRERRVPAAAIAAEPFIDLDPSVPISRAVHCWATRQGIALRTVSEIQSCDAIKDAVVRGNGIAVVSEVSAHKEIGAGELETIAAVGFPLSADMSIAWRRGGAAAHIPAAGARCWRQQRPETG